MATFTYPVATGGVGPDEVTGAEIRLDNDQYLRARNAADSDDVNILKVTTSDTVDIVNIRNINSATNGLNISSATNSIQIDAIGAGQSLFLIADFVDVFGGGAAASTMRLYEDAGINFVGLKSPAVLGADYTLTLPIDDGTPGQVLSTNGDGILSWISAGSGATIELDNLGTTAINAHLLFDTADTYDIGASSSAAANVYTNNVKSPNSLGLDSQGDLEITNANDAIHLYADTVAPSIFFWDDTTSFAVGLKAPGTLAADYTLTLPPDDGPVNGILSTDSSGIMSWEIDLKDSAGDPAIEFNDPTKVIFTNRGYIGTWTGSQAAWGADLPGLVIDATTGEGATAFGGGLFLKGNSSNSLAILTEDKSSTDNSASIFLSTGYTVDGNSGQVDIDSGQAVGTGNSGNINIISGAATGGISGSILLTVSAASSVTNRGSVIVNAKSFRFPVAASDPTGVTLGDAYVNSGTNKIKFYNGAGWETVVSA